MNSMQSLRFLELKIKLDKALTEVERIDILIEMAIEQREYNIEEAEKIADFVIEKSKAINYKLGIGRGLNLKGWCYWQYGSYDEGISCLQASYAISKEVNNLPLRARVLNNFGNIYRDKGELANALNNYEKSLAINEEIGDEIAQSINLTNLAYLLYDLGVYENALEYALKCLPIFQKDNGGHRIAALYNLLGNIYFKLEQFHEAMSYYEENVASAHEDTVNYVVALCGVGKVYYKMEKYDEASRFLQQSLTLALQIESFETEIMCRFYMAKMEYDKHNYQDALDNLLKAYDLASEYSRRHDLMSIDEALSAVYDKMDNIPKAYAHLKEYEKLKEDIIKQSTINKLHNLQAKQAIELAQKEKEVAERTAHLKQQFMANMSHEIRTPMNAIVGMTRLLLGKNPSEEQVRYLKAIQQSADNLLVIINDILDISKIEANKIIIEHTSFSIKDVVQSVQDMLMLKAEEKKIDFNVVLASDIPKRVYGDPTRVNQILVNLAGNAVKFTEKGFVKLSAFVSRQENDTFYIQFDIEDTGIGISEEYIDKIFENFTQAGTDTARKYGGTGLGLSISKQLTTLMKGDIKVKSKLGQGTTFSVIIPFDIADDTADTNDNRELNDDRIQELNKVRLLLVEDNEFNRMVAEDTLKELLPKIKIDIAENGQVAVEKVRENAYDVVLMDIQMPVMNGMEATKIIRKDLPEDKRHVKIIAMTANVLQEDVKRYFELGMNAYVSKPFNTDELLLKMSKVIEDIDLTEPPEVKERSGVDNEKPLPEVVTDLAFLKQFTGAKEEKMFKYINMFLENAPRLLSNIDEGLAQKDLPAVKIAAHSLKPQLGYMGVKEEISHIFLIEQTAGESGHVERLYPLVKQLHRVCDKAFEELKAFK